jgi:hypothetical protein
MLPFESVCSPENRGFEPVGHPSYTTVLPGEDKQLIDASNSPEH